MRSSARATDALESSKSDCPPVLFLAPNSSKRVFGTLTCTVSVKGKVASSSKVQNGRLLLPKKSETASKDFLRQEAQRGPLQERARSPTDDSDRQRL